MENNLEPGSSGVFRFNSFACHTDKAIKNVHLFVTLVMIILMAFDRYIVMEDKEMCLKLQ